ncbi:MAG TPA: hypothetical protein VK838_03105 [Candidatus Limnocylindrales bacterium]|nr:hypothetical protein [Candidatus Limnocylindrales bacterium]
MPTTRRKATADATQPEPAAEPVAEPVAVTADVADPLPRRSGPGRLVRATIAILVVVAFALGVVIVWPFVYKEYIAPIGTNTADLGDVRAQLAEMQGRLDALESGQTGLDDRVTSVEGQLAEHQRRLAALDAMGDQLAAADDAARGEVAREVSLLKAMELMSRGRLFLYESNFGLAAQDLAAARDLLAGLDGGTSGADADAIATAVDRLDRTLAALPDFPVVASDDLDIAWQALLGNVAPAVEATATPAPTATPTPQPSPTATP